jgi:DNA-binding transcriptional LysR family regulator
VGPRFEEIEAELEALSELREKPAGTIRINAIDYVADTILWPKLAKLLREYPDIKAEIIIDYGLTDIVAQRYDAGVRLGEQVAKDMIAVRIGPDLRMAVVAAPSYFRERSEPKTPQDLISHNCINLRLPTYGGLYAWEFAKGNRELKYASKASSSLTGRRPHAERGAGRVRPGLCAGGSGAAPSRQGPSQARAGRLVPALFRLSSLLPEPSAAHTGVRLAGRCAALPGLKPRQPPSGRGPDGSASWSTDRARETS